MDLRLFSLEATQAFSTHVARCIGMSLSEHEERSFEDGEHKARPLIGVRGQDVYVIQSLYGGPKESVSEKFLRLLFFLGALREGGAARVTAVMPYLCYQRKDRQTKARDPVTTRYVAQLLEAVGVDAVMTLEVHNIVAFQNAFRTRSEHLDTRRLFAERLKDRVGDAPLVVASPDPGGVKRAQLFRETLQAMLGRDIGSAYLEKRRSSGVVTGDLLAGEVAGACVLIVDDMISSGGTMLRAAETCLAKGALEVHALAAHGLFTEGAEAVLQRPELASVMVTDTVPPFRLSPSIAERRVEIVSAAPLIGEAILRCHENRSIVGLLEPEA
jgi:ribose-phosphate pyrophosphokinase